MTFLPGKKFILPVLFIIVMIAAWEFGLKHIFSLAHIQASGTGLKHFIELHRTQGLLIFLGIYFLAICVCLPVAALLDLLAGFLFGTLVGGCLVLIGATGGAAAIFLMTKSSLGKTLRNRAGTFYTRAEKEMMQGATSYLLFMRLVPVFPFALVNIIPALFNVPLFTFLWTTIIGIAPVTFIYANLGQTLGTISSLHDLFSLKLALALGLLGVLALIPLILKKAKARRSLAKSLVDSIRTE